MKNKFLVFVLLFVITIPQIASAAWWNPLSWKVFSRIFSPKVEVIETNIPVNQEPNNEEDEIEKLRAEVEELKKGKEVEKTEPKPTSNSEPAVKPVVSKPAITSPTIQPQTNTAVTYESVIKKYKDFLPIIESEISGLKKNSTLSTEKAYFNFLDSVLIKINSDLGYLESIKYWDPRPAGIEITYLTKFNSLKSDYDMRARGYRVDFEEEKLTIAKQNIEQETQTNSSNTINVIRPLPITIGEPICGGENDTIIIPISFNTTNTKYAVVRVSSDSTTDSKFGLDPYGLKYIRILNIAGNYTIEVSASTERESSPVYSVDPTLTTYSKTIAITRCL